MNFLDSVKPGDLVKLRKDVYSYSLENVILSNDIFMFIEFSKREEIDSNRIIVEMSALHHGKIIKLFYSGWNKRIHDEFNNRYQIL